MGQNVIDTPRHRNQNSLAIQHPSMISVSGATMCGKTRWVVNQLLDKNCAWDRCHVVCDPISAAQSLYAQLSDQFKGKGKVTIHGEGLPESDEQETEFDNQLKKDMQKGYQTVVVIDDCGEAQGTARGGRWVGRMTSSARHCNASVITINQSHAALRKARLNCSYIVLFAHHADRGSARFICQQVSPEDGGKALMQAYKQATDKPHGCLILDVSPNAPAILRARDTDMDRCFDLSRAYDGNNQDDVGEEE
jgi:hypothetical protein